MRKQRNGTTTHCNACEENDRVKTQTSHATRRSMVYARLGYITIIIAKTILFSLQRWHNGSEAEAESNAGAPATLPSFWMYLAISDVPLHLFLR